MNVTESSVVHFDNLRPSLITDQDENITESIASQYKIRNRESVEKSDVKAT